VAAEPLDEVATLLAEEDVVEESELAPEVLVSDEDDAELVPPELREARLEPFMEAWVLDVLCEPVDPEAPVPDVLAAVEGPPVLALRPAPLPEEVLATLPLPDEVAADPAVEEGPVDTDVEGTGLVEHTP
jgi:hypothetical protein